MPKKKSVTSKRKSAAKPSEETVSKCADTVVDFEAVQSREEPWADKPSEKLTLTDLEEFWVEQNCKNGKSLEDVKTANIKPVALVEAHYKKIRSEIQEKANDVKTSSLFGRNEKYGAVVMTQNASEVGDSKKQSNNKARKVSEAKQNHIHKFRN